MESTLLNILLRVDRFSFHPNWTLGRFFIKDKQAGFSVEDEIREVKLHGETAIPAGTYELALRYSPKFSRSFKWCEEHKLLIDAAELKKYDPEKFLFVDHQLIWLKNVPQFQYILMHWGNTDLDTDGCIITGSKLGVFRGREAVLSSRHFYKQWYPQVMPLIKEGGQAIRINNLKQIPA